MQLYAQVKNNLVVNVWTSPPKVAIGEDGWMNAEEVLPEIDNSQEYGEYTYSIQPDKVVISRKVIDIPISTRKQRLLDANSINFISFAELAGKNPYLYSQEDILANKEIAKQNKLKIESATTHTELNNLVLDPLNLF